MRYLLAALLVAGCADNVSNDAATRYLTLNLLNPHCVLFCYTYLSTSTTTLKETENGPH